MSAIQDLETNITDFPGRIRAAKDACHYTIEELADLSGVSYSAVARLVSGTQADPKLYNSAALCRTLGLSLDELFALAPPSGTDAELIQRAHEAELAAAAARGESDALRATFEGTRAYALRQARSTVILAALCALLSLVVLGYLIFDHTLIGAGLILNGQLTPLAWMLVVLLIAALSVAGRAVFHAREHQP